MRVFRPTNDIGAIIFMPSWCPTGHGCFPIYFGGNPGPCHSGIAPGPESRKKIQNRVDARQASFRNEKKWREQSKNDCSRQKLRRPSDSEILKISPKGVSISCLPVYYINCVSAIGGARYLRPDDRFKARGAAGTGEDCQALPVLSV